MFSWLIIPVPNYYVFSAMNAKNNKRVFDDHNDSDAELEDTQKSKTVAVIKPIIPVINTNAFGLIVPVKRDQPIIANNAVGKHLKTDEERYRIDMEMRQVEDADYSKMPIESFGEAVLRGMGWTEGKPVGKNQSKIVKPVELKPRPLLAGLGAQLDESFQVKNERKIRPGDKIINKPVNSSN